MRLAMQVTRAVVVVFLVLPVLFLSFAATSQERPKVGLILPDGGGNLFIQRMIEAAESKASALSFDLLITQGDTQKQSQSASDMIAQSVNAIIVWPTDPVAFEGVAGTITEQDIPLIAIDQPVAGASATVLTDEFAAGELVGKWAKSALLQDGPSRVGVVGFSNDTPLEAGVVAGMAADDPPTLCNPDAKDTPAETITSLIDTCADIAAIVTPDPLTGVEALSAIKNRGSDIGVVALGNGCGSLLDMAAGDGPKIAMFKRPEALSEVALDEVAAMISGGSVSGERVDVGVDLITQMAVNGVPTFGLDAIPEAIRRQCEMENQTQCCTESNKSCCPPPPKK